MKLWQKRLLFAAPFIIIAAVLLAVSGCGSTQTAKEPVYRESFALGTLCRQTIYEGDESVLAEGEAILYDIDARMSLFRDTSEVEAINGSADFVPVSEDVYAVLEKALRVSGASGGAFDVTMGALTHEWDIVNDPHVPEGEVIERLLESVGYEQIELADGAVRTPEGVVIDLGGIAKGAALDRLAELYRERGVESALLNLGGSIHTIGINPAGRPFRIGITDPMSSGDYFALVDLQNASMVTSGAYERNFTENGVLYHHILDPKTGYPSDSGIISVSIIGSDAAIADAASTAVYVLGLEKGMALAEELGVDALLVDRDGLIYTTEGFAEKYSLELHGDSYRMAERADG